MGRNNLSVHVNPGLGIVYFTLVIPFTLMLFTAGCSFNYEEAEVATELSRSLPDTILHNLEQIQVKKDKNTIILKAGKAENYENQHKTIVENFRFEERNNQDQIITEGEAAKAVYYNDTENAELDGNIKFHSKKEGVKIYADNLVWEKATKQLKTAPGSTVTLEKEDGSYVKGNGFYADLRRKEITFKDRVEGSYTKLDNETNK